MRNRIAEGVHGVRRALCSGIHSLPIWLTTFVVGDAACLRLVNGSRMHSSTLERAPKTP